MLPDISVVITTYNQPFDVIARSLTSVIMQRGIDLEIVIADDGSDNFSKDSYDAFFRDNNFTSYQIIHSTKNQQTVKNLLDGVRACSAPYVKPIDAGDMLYAKDALASIHEVCLDPDFYCGFHDIVKFIGSDNDGVYYAEAFHAPRQTAFYQSNQTAPERAKILRAMMNSADWIPAPAQFYRTDYYAELLERLHDDFEVRYCQDFTAVLAIIDHPIIYMPQPAYWYEWGTGISTSGSLASRKRLYHDHRLFYTHMRNLGPFSLDLSQALRAFKLREFIALRTPLYDALLKFSNRPARDRRVISDPFFRSCIARNLI